MKVNTKRRKKARKGFRQIYGENELADKMFHVIQTGKQGIDAVILELGKMVAEAIMEILISLNFHPSRIQRSSTHHDERQPLQVSFIR